MWYDNDQGWTYDYDKETKKAAGADKECRTFEDVGTGEGKITETEETMKTGDAIIRQSYYFHSYSENEFLDEKYYGLIFGTENVNCWLAGRHVQLFGTGCSFGVQFVEKQRGGQGYISR